MHTTCENCRSTSPSYQELDDRTVQAFENGELRAFLGPKGKEEPGEGRKIQDEELHIRIVHQISFQFIL